MDKSKQLSKFLNNYNNRLNHLFNQIDKDQLELIIECFITSFKNGNKLFIAGNGGSAATASHMKADFSFYVRYFTDFRPKIISLTDNMPIITAIGNDTSYDDIFVEQLKGNFEKGDVFLAISASGNSPNVVNAVNFVNKNGGKSVSFCGFKGGILNKISHLRIFTPSLEKEYGPVEDIHMILMHMLVNFICEDKDFLKLR